MSLDTQQVELVGRSALESQLIRQRFEVARPHRDKGVDLLIYRDEPTKPFSAIPLQIKASSGTTFGVWRKYEKMAGLVMVYIWHVLDSPRFFLMTYAEAAQLVPASTKQTKSWNKPLPHAGWSWPSAPQHVVKNLGQFENRWDWLRDQVNRSTAGRGALAHSNTHWDDFFESPGINLPERSEPSSRQA